MEGEAATREKWKVIIAGTVQQYTNQLHPFVKGAIRKNTHAKQDFIPESFLHEMH